jgi:hypothetical protein
VTIDRVRRHLSALGALIMPGLVSSLALGEVHVLSHGALRVEIEVSPHRHMAEFGPRFDRTAIVTSITVDGIELLGSWGLCDEFGLYGNGVLGYEKAARDGHFVKIGIGTLVRDTDRSYHFAHPYPVHALFPVQVEVEEGEITVLQDSDASLPERYHYRKNYTIGEGNTLTIRYRLQNTGARPWSFEHYNHHWFRLEGAAVGPRYAVLTGFELPAVVTNFLLEPSALRMSGVLQPDQAAWYGSDLPDASTSANGFELLVDGRRTVRYEASFAPARFALYASQAGFCPEVFKRSTLQAGETASWSATYQFFVPPQDRLPQ